MCASRPRQMVGKIGFDERRSEVAAPHSDGGVMSEAPGRSGRTG